MATIRPRKRKDGGISYTAQIRIMREGVQVYQESQTFSQQPASKAKAMAKSWAGRREAELSEPGAIERAGRGGTHIKVIIDRYLSEYERIRPLGKTKRQALKAIGNTWLGDVADKDLTSQVLVSYGQWRMSPEGGGVKPQTIGNDMSHLGAVLSVARPAWGYQIDPHALQDAKVVLKKLGLISRSAERDRRPTHDELGRALNYYCEMQLRRPASINMPKILAFAIFSTRREDEICRIRWSDFDEDGQRVLVRDMKNPGQKAGNNVWCSLPDEAMQIIKSMPRVCDEIFPYNSDSVSTSWTRMCKMTGIEDLRFHDLRHDGVSRLFEMGLDIPRVSSISGHRDWNSLRRYTHLRGRGDPYANWHWLNKIIALPVELGSRPRTKGRR